MGREDIKFHALMLAYMFSRFTSELTERLEALRKNVIEAPEERENELINYYLSKLISEIEFAKNIVEKTLDNISKYTCAINNIERPLVEIKELCRL